MELLLDWHELKAEARPPQPEHSTFFRCSGERDQTDLQPAAEGAGIPLQGPELDVLRFIFQAAQVGACHSRPILDAGGVADISRWLSAAKPPDHGIRADRPRRGRRAEPKTTAWQACIPAGSTTPSGRWNECRFSGGHAGARPPANICDPFGVV